MFGPVVSYEDLFLPSCLLCGCLALIYSMSVPQAAFAVKKVKKNEELKKSYQPDNSKSLSNYNSKYMNSIWGLYNRYSCHNLKMHSEENFSGKNPVSDKKDLKNLGAFNNWGLPKYM